MSDPLSTPRAVSATAHHISVPRTARYHVLGALPTESEPPLRELWLVAHGYGQLAGRFIRHFAPLADGSRLIVAPEALSRFYLEHPGRSTDTRVGATWMTREDREAEIADQVRYLDLLVESLLEQGAGVRPRLHVLGFSQGVATVVRWLALGRARADHLVLWSGRIPADVFPLDAAHPLRRAALDVVTGAGDEFATAEVLAEQAALIRREGLAPRHHTHPDGHRMHGPTLVAIAATWEASGPASGR